MWTLGFLLLLLLAGIAGTVVALRDTLLGDAVRVPVRRELLPPRATPRDRR